MRRQEAARHARLAQLVEHLLDVQEVTGSSPVPRTKSPSGHSGGDFSVYRRGKNQAKSPTFFKKGLAFCKNICYTNMRCQSAAQYARLAQLVEHLLDVQEVTGSSPVPRTKSPSGHSGGDFSVYRRGKNQAKSPTFFKKGLAFCKNICYTNMRCQSAAQYARLAQLVEHLLDVQEVTGSSPVPRTKSPSGHPPVGIFLYTVLRIFGQRLTKPRRYAILVICGLCRTLYG